MKFQLFFTDPQIFGRYCQFYWSPFQSTVLRSYFRRDRRILTILLLILFVFPHYYTDSVFWELLITTGLLNSTGFSILVFKLPARKKLIWCTLKQSSLQYCLNEPRHVFLLTVTTVVPSILGTLFPFLVTDTGNASGLSSCASSHL